MILLGCTLVVVLCGLLSWLSRSDGASRDEEVLLLYCAAGVKPPVSELVKLFEAQFGIKVEIQYGGSGSLLSNITVYRRGDLYIAADQSYIDQARERQLVQEVFPLAKQNPVIVVSKGNPRNIQSLDDLLLPGLRLALGNPEVASIGRQTKIQLEKAGYWDEVLASVQKRGVFKPAVPEIANDVKLGAVDAGIVWDATAAQFSGLEEVSVPILDQAVEEISIAILLSSHKRKSARKFVSFFQGEVGREVFERYGYDAGDSEELNPNGPAK